MDSVGLHQECRPKSEQPGTIVMTAELTKNSPEIRYIQWNEVVSADFQVSVIIRGHGKYLMAHEADQDALVAKLLGSTQGRAELPRRQLASPQPV